MGKLDGKVAIISGAARGQGEAEARETNLSTPALARWRDDAHTILYCPRCGVEERLKT